MSTTEEDEDRERDEGGWTHPPEGEQEDSIESPETLGEDERSVPADDE